MDLFILSSNGEELFKKFNQKVWFSIIEFLDLTSAFKLASVSKYFNSGNPNFWKALRRSHYHFDYPTKSPIENYEKDLFMGHRFIDFLQSYDPSKKKILTSTDVIQRASTPDLLLYLDAMLDMTVTSQINKQFSHGNQKQKSETPYLILSLFSSEQRVVLWWYKFSDLSNGTLNLFAKFNFEDLSLRPCYARFLGNELFYIEFECSRLRLYNLINVNLHSTDPDEPVKDYEYEIFIADSQLTIRSPSFDGKTKDRELTFTLDSPLTNPAKWQVKVLESGVILCLEKYTKTLILLNMRLNPQQSSCKVISIQREFMNTFIDEIWISPKLEDGAWKIYFYCWGAIYLLKMPTEWNNSAEIEKIQVKHIFKRPIIGSPLPKYQAYKFFSWMRSIHDKPENKVDACIIQVNHDLCLVDLENGDMKKIFSSGLTINWIIFNNLILFPQLNSIEMDPFKKLEITICQISLFLDCSFGSSVQAVPTVTWEYDIGDYGLVYLINYHGCIAAVRKSNQSMPTNIKGACYVDIIFFHSLHFRPESIPAKEKSKSTTSRSLLNVSALNKHVRLAIKSIRLPKLEIMIKESNGNYFGDSLEVIGSMIFLRGQNYTGFIDPSSQYYKFEKSVNTKPINLTTSNTVEEIGEPAKLKLINYQELVPNPNTTMIAERSFEHHHQTKTAMKKELKGLSKSQKQEMMTELANNNKKILGLPKEEPNDSEEEVKDPEVQDDTKTIADKNAISTSKRLEKMAKVQEKQEHREKARKKDKNLKGEVYSKYFG